jgi:two-component system sensor histidine kinase SenX3
VDRKAIANRPNRIRETRTVYASWRQRVPLFWIAVLLSIAILLAIVATLQYRWSTEIKEAQQVRLATDLESVMIKWHLDFYGEFSTVCVALQIGPDSGERDSWEDYLHRYTQWSRTANSRDSVNNLYSNGDLVRDIYIWETSRRRNPRLLRLNPGDDKIEDSATPSALQPLLTHLRANSSSLPDALQAWKLTKSGADRFAGGAQVPSPSHLLRSNAETGWQFDENIPALVHPIFHYSHHRAIDTKTLSSVDPVDWVVVVLNLETIQKRILPELRQRYFSGRQGLDYKVAVLAAATPTSRLLYSSDSGFGAGDISVSDSVMDIFGPPPDNTEQDLWQLENHRASLRGKDWHRFSSPVWFPIIEPTSNDGPWLLVVQNRKRPLGATVSRVWHRNLLAGGLVLLLLAVTMVLVVVASQRAQALASLQMDFVASVSHELRTPVAVILSAGENIRDGLVEDRKVLMEQGSIITEQANQLMGLVDHVLLFAATARGVAYHNPRPLQVSEILESALRNTSGLLHEAGFTVEQELQPGLPRVIGDLSALSQCLENLIVNAVKYSNRDRWIGLSAGLDETSNNRKGLRISVADHGVGIGTSDLSQIFEPFYRCPQSIAAQIHGTGLGLSIAKRIAEAFGGSLSVVSELGAGSVFTLHLQLADELISENNEVTLGIGGRLQNE